MKLYYGIESNVDEINLNSLPVAPEDHTNNIFIVNSLKEAELLKGYLVREQLFEDEFPLLCLDHPMETPVFLDYGIKTHSNRAYLLSELVCGFSIIEGHEQEKAMALIQMEEHLIAIDTDHNQINYFVDNNQKELIQGIANAYRLEVSFLDLDK